MQCNKSELFTKSFNLQRHVFKFQDFRFDPRPTGLECLWVGIGNLNCQSTTQPIEFLVHMCLVHNLNFMLQLKDAFGMNFIICKIEMEYFYSWFYQLCQNSAFLLCNKIKTYFPGKQTYRNVPRIRNNKGGLYSIRGNICHKLHAF